MSNYNPYHRPHPSSAAPRGYVPGLGRGAAGFTTRSDIGPAATAPDGAGGVVGSRASELRAAKLQQQAQQRQQQQAQAQAQAQAQRSFFGAAPRGYVPGAGRGAGGGAGGGEDGPTGAPDAVAGARSAAPEYDAEDEEADAAYDAVTERMRARGKRKRRDGDDDDDDDDGRRRDGGGGGGGGATDRVAEQFRELKEGLRAVTEDEWEAIPDVGDRSLRHRQKRREDVFTPLPDSLLAARSDANAADEKGRFTAAAADPSNAVDGGGYRSVVTNMSGLAEARGAVLGMSLDRTADGGGGATTSVDPGGYLTSLDSVRTATDTEIDDVNKARLLLKSVRDTNPRHAPGWIAAARVEEAADKPGRARKIILAGCEACPEDEDVWLEAARLHPTPAARTVLATAVRRLPRSVRIFVRAAELESRVEDKRRVLRRALENVPNSVTLWKAAVELEDAEDARILLGVAVEKVPHSVEMWLALAKLETHKNARRVLNRARKHLPAERAIWIAAAKLEEANMNNVDKEEEKPKQKEETKEEHGDDKEEKNVESKEDDDASSSAAAALVDRVVSKAVRSLARAGADVGREQWLREAVDAELAGGAPLTAAAIVRHAVGLGVEPEDRLRTWAADAADASARGAVAVARAVTAASLAAFPTRRAVWTRAVELERAHGTRESLDEVLGAAAERSPRAEIFWLLRARGRWDGGDVEGARRVLADAFEANPDSEQVWLAAAKLEWETGEAERARELLKRAREGAPSARVYMKAASLERHCGDRDAALDLVERGIALYPDFDKLYMMGGQMHVAAADEIDDDDDAKRRHLDRARRFYRRGLNRLPQSDVLWTLAAELEETRGRNVPKARSLLETARLRNPKHARLWLHSIRLERRAGLRDAAAHLSARALQELPDAGELLADRVADAPRAERRARSADAVKRRPDDAAVVAVVADLFRAERRRAKARRWFERAVALDPDRGDAWAAYYRAERDSGDDDAAAAADKVRERCAAADPKHGETWCRVRKNPKNHGKTTAEILDLVVERMVREEEEEQARRSR